MKKQIFCPPLTDELTKYGDKFEKIVHNEANGMYCYKRTASDGLTYYEVFKAPKETRGAGQPYDRYPSTEQFGFGRGRYRYGNPHSGFKSTDKRPLNDR